MSQLIQFCREPLLVFVTLFLLSLLAAVVLFKFLESRATIKRRWWSAGGAIAGFVLILFGSWYSLTPAISAPLRVDPLSLPAGYKAYSASDLGIAIAIPRDWAQPDRPTDIAFSPQQQ